MNKNNLVDDQASAGGKSKASSRINRGIYPPGAAGAAGGPVNAEF